MRSGDRARDDVATQRAQRGKKAREAGTADDVSDDVDPLARGEIEVDVVLAGQHKVGAEVA